MRRNDRRIPEMRAGDPKARRSGGSCSEAGPDVAGSAPSIHLSELIDPLEYRGDPPVPESGGRLVRLAETGRTRFSFYFDGEESLAMQGDTVLTAILLSRNSLRAAEFGPEQRAGFCLMGACQDCWVWQEHGPRLRACSTLLEPGMRLLSEPPSGWPREQP